MRARSCTKFDGAVPQKLLTNCEHVEKVLTTAPKCEIMGRETLRGPGHGLDLLGRSLSLITRAPHNYADFMKNYTMQGLKKRGIILPLFPFSFLREVFYLSQFSLPFFRRTLLPFRPSRYTSLRIHHA